LLGVPIAVLVGLRAIGWAALTLKTWNDGDTLTATDLNANFAAINAALSPDGGAVTVNPPLTGNGSAASPLGVKSVYEVWGRTACGNNDSVIHTGFLASFGTSTGVLGGGPMCLDDALALANWTSWGASIVSRAKSTTMTVGDRSEAMSKGDVKCAVCKGFSYVLWGRTTCDPADAVIYTGHIAHFSYNSPTGYGGGNNSGPVCLDDAQAGATWVNWTGNSMIVRAAGANATNLSQYLEAREAPCVVCQ
jgi:hypothetical protein